MPVDAPNDLEDVPEPGRAMAALRLADLEVIQEHGDMDELVQAYTACIRHADELVGRVLESLETSRYAGNTIVVFWSDHGYHFGEKHHFAKNTLWERSSHVPLAIIAPGVTVPGTKSSRPVSLLNLYPTLVELCGLPDRQDLEGVSLRPLLENPGMDWDRPAVMTFGRGNHAVRSERYRYIRYANGDEEFYDHATDPDELTNLAEDPGGRVRDYPSCSLAPQGRRTAGAGEEGFRVRHRILQLAPSRTGVAMIDRRDFLKTGVGAASLASVTAQAAKSDLNVLFVAVDDLRPDLGCYGNESIRTPHIDRLASRSLVFERAYCQAPVCGPSRASLLTGLRPDTTKVWANRTHFRETAPDAVTLPQQFKQTGYFTEAIGKILHGEDGRRSFVERPSVASGRSSGWHAVRRYRPIRRVGSSRTGANLDWPRDSHHRVEEAYFVAGPACARQHASGRPGRGSRGGSSAALARPPVLPRRRLPETPSAVHRATQVL